MSVTTFEITREEIKGNATMALTILKTPHSYALPTVVEETEHSYVLHVDHDSNVLFEEIYKLPLEEKLRYLINIGQLFHRLNETVYTYDLNPENIVFTKDGIAKIVRRGVEGQIFPYEKITEEDFLTKYKSVIVSVLDMKENFEELSQGKLPFYQGNKFCERIVASESMEEALALLQEDLVHEKEHVETEIVRVPQKKLFFWKISTIVLGVLSFILISFLGYSMLVSQPRQQTISNLRLAFTQKDYSGVISSVKTLDSKSLDVTDKYLVAYSVIMTESLTDKQKETLGKITTQTNEDYLHYWVLIGQNKIDEAMDIASFLDDPQLLMYSLAKKIDEVQRDPSLTSEKRTETINNYKSKLEELKKQFLPDQAPKNS